MTSRRLLLVHAHPDDECISTGGVIARYARAQDSAVCLVTCTNGELGEIADVPDLGPAEEIRPRLGDVRRRELRDALAVLGPVDLRLLGYHDSGMDGTEGNDDPVAFVNQPMEEAVGKLVDVIRGFRPQVLVTYNEYGFYGHPDHIRAHEVAVAAIDAAADPAYGDGAAHHVAKLYYNAVPKSALRMGAELFADAGEDRWDAAEIERIGTDDDAITTVVDVAEYVDDKYEALRAHRTQLGTTAWFFEMPDDLRNLVMGTEYYVLARSTAPRPEGIEQDLFEGL